jgi:hypothetical protein
LYKQLTFSRSEILEIIAAHLGKFGWSWGCVAVVDGSGRHLFVVDAHRGDGRRYVVRSDEKLTAFLEMEAITTQIAA